jgi:hypothetical protein
MVVPLDSASLTNPPTQDSIPYTARQSMGGGYMRCTSRNLPKTNVMAVTPQGVLMKSDAWRRWSNRPGSNPAVAVIQCHCSCGLRIVTASIELPGRREYRLRGV